MATRRARGTTVTIPAALARHLATWLGSWPPATPLEVVGSPARTRPGWDGGVRRFLGISTPDATLLSVPPEVADAVRALGTDWRERLAAILDRPDAAVGRAVFRWSTAVADLDDLGVWLPADDPQVPGWLRPFGGEVLMALSDGGYLGGVGRKIHDRYGHELAVVTEEAARGRGVARRLVATAARRVLADGAVPTYLHLPENTASAKVADATGFPDRGWSVWELFDPRGRA